jgi:hypothetical protein
MATTERPIEIKPDFDRIRTNHERELHGWAKTMGTSPERLKQAVRAVGITPRKVRAYLRSMG